MTGAPLDSDFLLACAMRVRRSEARERPTAGVVGTSPGVLLTTSHFGGYAITSSVLDAMTP